MATEMFSFQQKDFFSNFVDEITAWKETRMCRKPLFEDSVYDKIPDEYYQDFESIPFFI